MALSLSNFLYPILALCLPAICHAATVTYDWNITWVTANPDGLLSRPVIGVNGVWPCPLVNVTKGDRVVFNVHNLLGNESTSLHFHGLFQNGTASMDGPPGVSQCSIPPGASFTYNFTLTQSGTYWWHSHSSGQFADGLRAQVYVNDPESPYLGKYDQEYMITISDWYHEQVPKLMASFISYTNPTGAEPVPNAALINDSQNVTFKVEPGKTYLFHLSNVGAFAGQYFWIEGHTMRIVEVDGVWTEEQEVDMFYATVAQRYSFLVTARNDTSANFAIVGAMDQDLFDVVPASLNPNVTAYLLYNTEKDLPQAALIDEYNPYDDFLLVPYSREPLWTDPAQTFELTMAMGNLDNGANYAFVNGVTYVAPKVPTLYSALTTGNYSTDAAVYGRNTNSFVLGYGQVIEIILNNADSGRHPFHLHGHNFQAVVRSAEDAGYYATPQNATAAELPAIPMQRDTFMVYGHGHYVIRFRSFNPGVWLFHCHIEWHFATGLTATFVEAPLHLQESLTIPEDHLNVCKLDGVSTSGNAAGNTVDYLDLTGESSEPAAPIPAGFTARGIVALVFSAVSAILGMAVIAWYGAAPISAGEFASAKKTIDEANLADYKDDADPSSSTQTATHS